MPEKTVTVQLMGGLGNQLFQIFTVLAYSIQHSVTCVLPYPILGGRPHYWHTFFENWRPTFRELQIQQELCAVYKEPHFHYAVLPEYETSVRLVGYFQSPRYFDAHREEICKTIGLEKLQAACRNKYADPYFDTPRRILSMHFRQGDYIKYPQHHPILPVGYYKEALKRIFRGESMRVLYFCESDDAKHVSENYIRPLKLEFPSLEFVWVDNSIQDWEQLIMMSLCDDFIIANSSFSWWGAYLSGMHEKSRVLYPSKWFGPALCMNNTQDLFCQWESV